MTSFKTRSVQTIAFFIVVACFCRVGSYLPAVYHVLMWGVE